MDRSHHTLGAFAGRLATLVGLVAAVGAAAGPVEDHQRGLRAYQQGDVVAAMAALRPAAQAGHAPSQALLAFILDRADFADEAASLYRQAAQRDDAEGHAGMANLYLTGRGVAKDEKAALLHFSKAADRGHAASAELLAEGWLNRRWGLDPQKDGPSALAAWRRAAAIGHLPSIDMLAQAHAEGGFGLAADTAQAASWRDRARALRQQRGQAASAAPAASGSAR